MLNGKSINPCRPACKHNHKMHTPYEILDIISPMAIRLGPPQTLTIYAIFHASLIELFVTGNRDMDLNAPPKTSDLVKNAREYDAHKAMGSTEQDWKVLYLVK
jgi:hypothetical protein